MNVITMTAYRRPAYTREVLTALAKCEGIAGWLLLPNVEPGNDEVIAAFREWNACEMRLVVNKKRLGLNRNTHEAVYRAFKLRADVTLHLEDDTVPSPDALRYFDWAVRELLIPDVKSPDGCQILLASGYNKPRREPPTHRSHDCETRPIWTPWGWAVDRKRLTLADRQLVLRQSKVLHVPVPLAIPPHAPRGIPDSQSHPGDDN